MGLPPIVTGISPKEGPPGTRVTIRGENLGYGPEDIIGLNICGSDCLLSAEWKSSNKIVARSGPGKGRGDIVIVTKSGGIGSCTVQFRGYHETTGPLKESAVWVDESHLSGLGRHRQLIPSTFQQEDPLGLSVENAGKKFPEEDLHDLFPEGSGDLGSENFTSAWFLLEHHHATSFDDLKAGLSFLRRKVETQKEGQITFLKTHAGSVIEQMDTLIALKAKVEENKLKYGPDLTASLQKIILMANVEADRLFQDVLERKDRADSTRNAIATLHRYRFLFYLPASLDKNIQKADYDLIINDYARAKTLFGRTEVQLFKRVLQEADQRILSLRNLLAEKLQKFPNTLDEQKKIIRNLVSVETPGDPAWDCITGQYRYSSNVLFQCKDEFWSKEQEESGKINQQTKTKKMNSLAPPSAEYTNNTIPVRIIYVEELSEIFSTVFPEFRKLGQAYFSGELYVRVESSRQNELKRMMLDIVTIFSQLIRAAFLPHTLDRSSPHRAQFGIWSTFNSTYSDQEGIGSWYVSCLRTIRTCYSNLLSLDLPTEILKVVRDLLHDLRVHCMRSLLLQAAENVSSLANRETWQVEFMEQHGSITQLPHMFETQVIECLQLVKETVFQSEQCESNLMENTLVLNDLNTLVQKLLLSFPRALERLSTTESDQVEEINREVKLLLELSNCQYTMHYILPRLQDHWNKLKYPDLSLAIHVTKQQLINTDEKLLEAYLEEKVEPLIGIVEPSMYAEKFDWNKNLQPQDVRPYCKEIIMNMIAVHAEVAQVCPSLVHRILERVVREVGAELGRLFSCVEKFSSSGALQAKADITALSRACRTVIRDSEKDPFAEANVVLPTLESVEDQENLSKILNTFEQRMRFQLLCLDE